MRTIMGLRSDVIVRPNDTLFTPAAEVSAVSAPPRLLFFGRLAPIKGLDLLLEALREVQKPLTLDIYGPEEDAAYTERCRSLSQATSPEVEVRFLGPLPHERVAATVRGYDLMVAPTASENFGQSIAEGLSVGVPVMVSDVTPWTTVVQPGAGILVPERTAESWAASLNDYLDRSTNARAELKEGALAGFRDWLGHRATGGVLSDLEARVEARQRS
ncbi:MAG TPA: glycosyltransferase [Nocardioides sp.]|nr:glycosyltransferase [Nocardioides sp.]